MRIWSLSVSRLWMTVTAAFPSIALSSKSWKRQSARVRLTALWSRISAASQETTSTADVTLRRYSRSSAYASSQSMMRMTVLTGDPQSDSFVIPFKNLINDSYCKDISMKIRSSLEVKQKSGEFVGSFAPYGYMKSPENKNQLIVDEAVSEYVQMIFSMYKDGFSIGRIAKRLNQDGRPVPNGIQAFRRRKVRYRLQNRRYRKMDIQSRPAYSHQRGLYRR